MKYKVDFSYSGENFNGYQVQPGLRTVQGEIQKVLTMINNNKNVLIYSSGRTDAKVNALHQIMHFSWDLDLSPSKLKYALNSYLPDDIFINEITKTSPNFHARYDVKSKIYEYNINVGTYNPIQRNCVYQYCKKLDINLIKEASKYLLGTHDFTTFVCAENKNEDKVRTIYDIKIVKNKDILTIRFKGNGFMKYQVRNMVGLLIKIGEKKELATNIPLLIEKKDRKASYKTAPACGLTLIKVNYK